MDVQRMQAYVELIDQLLGCAQGNQLAALLQANAELVDAGLVAIMGQYADWLESQGHWDTAESLRQYATRLAQALGLEESSLSSASSGDRVGFLMEIVQLIAQTSGDRGQVYKFFRTNVERLDEALLSALQTVFADLIQQHDPSMIAAVLVTFGDLIQQFPFGSRMLNLEMGIAAFQLALQVYTRDAFPGEWAMTQDNLAAAYADRIRGERADNLEQSITAFQLALQVYTRDAFPEQWAATQNNLANAYSDRIRGERADNLEQAITAYQLALQVCTRDAFPGEWATTQNNLAVAYKNRIRGERADNLEQAIMTYQLALQVYTRDAFPREWAMTQNNLAAAYADRLRGERADNLEQAIMTYQLALQVYTRDAFPERWATTQHNLAAAYSDRLRGERADNLEQAITTYQLALQVYTRDAFPEQWAMTQNNLANAYADRLRGERADNLEQAITACQLALQVYTRDAFPERWAMTQNNLAAAYTDRLREERTDNLEQAITAYQLALQVYTRDAFPERWATTQNNLAAAYSDRLRGERADNLEQAITAYQLALQVYTRDAFPREWAMTQNNLTAAYTDRLRGERADNLEQAITACQLALQVYTRDAFPERWAMTQNNLANAYAHRLRGERADNLEQAITAYEQALQVHTRDAFPKGCRQTAQNLGNLHWQEKSWAAARDAYQIAAAAAETLYQASISYAGKGDELKATGALPRRLAYAHAQLGNLQTAVLTLEQSRARGLSESLDRDRANLTQLQTLAPILYNDYQTITQQLRNLESRDRDRMISIDRDRVPEDLIKTTTKLRQALDQTIAQIRQVSDYEDFLTLTQWKDIAIALRRNNPLVYLVTTHNGGMALIVTVDAIEVLWLNDLTETQLNNLLKAWFTTYYQSQTDRQAWYDVIDTTTRQLWDALMGPLVQKLQDLGFERITLIPTGYFSLLPLHAAWTEDETQRTGRRYAFDDIHITYAPNTKSLTAAQVIADRVEADAILAINEPKHRYLDPDTGEFKPVNPLPSSSREVASAIATFSTPTVLPHAEATRQAVLNALPNINVLHCSCHGNVDFQEPLKSGLAMTGDGEAVVLTLRDLLDLKLTDGDRGGIRLAILSACETGLIGIENADEAISLPTGLLQAGVAAVIASLWSVSELSTMILLSRFYTLWRTQHLPPSIALRTAQKWLRDAEPNAIVEHCATFIPDLHSQKELVRSLKLDYSHPYHWSAFSYTGV